MSKRKNEGNRPVKGAENMSQRDFNEKEPYLADGGVQSLEGKADLDKSYGTGRYLQDSEIDREFREGYADRNFTGRDNLHPGVMQNADLDAPVRTPHKLELDELDENGDVRNLNDLSNPNDLKGPDAANVGWGHDGDESRYASARYNRSEDRWHEDEYETDRPGRH